MVHVWPLITMPTSRPNGRLRWPGEAQIWAPPWTDGATQMGAYSGQWLGASTGQVGRPFGRLRWLRSSVVLDLSLVFHGCFLVVFIDKSLFLVMKFSHRFGNGFVPVVTLVKESWVLVHQWSRHIELILTPRSGMPIHKCFLLTHVNFNLFPPKFPNY